MSATPADREKVIRERAYAIWQGEGCPNGRDQAHWLQAEQELAGRRRSRTRSAAAGTTKAPKAPKNSSARNRTAKPRKS
ncbi:MAG TPA: DUF2934 domain-containing protein [Alphaproteobacteria bacterium]|jgi:hypothetical protein|nr:DUF2934 domain-containing protein [Alphaproteobacteria bacterium]